MEELIRLIEKNVEESTLIGGTLSNVKKGVDKTFSKVTIKPFSSKEGVKYQLEYTFDKKVTHRNCDDRELVEEIKNLLSNYFKNGVLFTEKEDLNVLISKKGKVTTLHKKPTKKMVLPKGHNRVKKYIIEDGENCDFLIHLGIMSQKGRVHAAKYNKFKQINKFLEIVENSLDNFNKKDTISIVDFGCGKAYLTFALYYYLVKKKGFKVDIIGLDLKEDVIDYCNEVAHQLVYDKLKFLKGDIKDYNGQEKVDMVITLHACDTATDAAIMKAVGWDAKVLLSVPCCQHELFKQIEQPLLKPMLKHGLIKERLSSLVTDAMRTQLLEIKGYEVTVIEFIDMEHTPKNLMIKAVYKGNPNEEALKEYEKYKEFWGYNAFLDDILKEK